MPPESVADRPHARHLVVPSQNCVGMQRTSTSYAKKAIETTDCPSVFEVVDPAVTIVLELQVVNVACRDPIDCFSDIASQHSIRA